MVAMVAALPRNCCRSANSCRNSSSATSIRSLRSRRSLMRTEASAISVSVFAIGSLLWCGRLFSRAGVAGEILIRQSFCSCHDALQLQIQIRKPNAR